MTTNELARQGDHFPLGAPAGEAVASEQVVLPFGLRYVTTAPPASVVRVDFTKISYDPVRQISLVTEDDGSLLLAMKHTSTSTSTSTASNDRKGNDSDTDSTGR
jgi:putative ATP-grasp target RiPP